MPRPLPLRANLEWLRKLSKERLDKLRASNPDSKLSEAQLAVAREFGFPSWRKLKDHVEQVREQLDAIVPADVRRQAATANISPDDPDLAQFLAFVRTGETQAVADALARRPALATAHASDGQTPLHVAAQFNDANIAAVLVAYGADVRAKLGQSQHSALSWAVTCNAMDCARALVKLGAEPDLFCAAGIGSLEHVQACFDAAGAPVPGASRTGSSRFAPDGSRLPCPPSAASEQVSDALYMASRNGQTEVVQFLLGKQPDLTFRAFLGATALHWAYFSGSQAVVDLLIQAGADPTMRDEVLHCTPQAFGISVAANWGFDFIVERLLATNPSLANPGDSRTSPLREAVRGGHAHVVRLLLDHKADPTFRDCEGKTPLEIAIESGHGDVAEMLKRAQS